MMSSINRELGKPKPAQWTQHFADAEKKGDTEKRGDTPKQTYWYGWNKNLRLGYRVKVDDPKQKKDLSLTPEARSFFHEIGKAD